VVFLIDGADEVDPVDFEQMKELIEFTVEKLPIRQNRVRLAVMQYSTHAKVEFALNAFYDKDKLQKEIMSIKQIGGRSFTGKALEEVAQAFEEADGGRANTLQFLVVVTDSLAKDNVTLPARALRDKNINIYAVGMGHANRDQLFEISGSRERVYLENNFGSMQNLGSEVIFKICNTECKRPELVDIIFLVDVAGSINKESFQSMKSFMETLVSKSEVGAKRVRIGTITYADQPQSEFTLIQYSSKAEVLKSISELRSLGGRRNTAQALKYSLSYFAAGHGGRRAQNIPQVLLLITDGPVADTYDLTDWPVDLKDSEVNMFAIGVAGAREDELRSITLNNQRAFYVDTYQDLEALYKPITQELCNLTKPVCEKEEADLVILIDGSESISSLDWETVKITLINLVKKLEIAPDKWQVGVAQFSDKLLDHFYLNQYNNVAGVEQGIRDITQRRQGTHTWAALKLVQDYFKTEHGSRINKGVSQNLLLVTDGKANDEEDLQSLAQIRAKDIEIFAIGIGSNINQHELLKIAGSKERIFFESFESLPLKTTTTKVLQAICIPSVILSPHGCLVDIGIGFAVSQRTSTQPLLGPHTETLVAAAVQRLSTMGQLCCLSVDAAETRIGFRLVSGREGKIIDDFAFEEYDENVARKVLALRPAIPMAFNALLLNSFKQKFASSQAGVKVVILFTDGLHDTLEHLKKSSDSLRESGVSALLIVALDGNVDYQQLEFGRGFSYNKPLSISMLNVGNALQDQIVTVASAECCNVSCACSGDVGFSGFPGLPGLKVCTAGSGMNVTGRRGLLGLNGTQGHQGCSGKRGIKYMLVFFLWLCPVIVYWVFLLFHAGHSQCPAYPTELVIALDVSADVTPQVFMRMRSAALSLLGDITIADTSCPVGARVSVVSYSNETNYLLRFSDHRQKKTLLEAVRGISLQRTRNTRNVGRAMRFVAQNVFKRVRDGKLVRKVAVFLTNGPSEEASGIATAMLEFKALDINLGVIAFRAAPDIRHAIQVADETRSFMMFDSQRATRIKQCVICFDRCHPDQTCGIIQSPLPEEVDVDLTVLMDASSDLQMDQYSGAKQLLLSLLDELAVSSDPDRKDGRPRVGVYQQSSAYPVTHIKEEFGLGTFKDRALMKRHISQGMQQAGGSSSLVHALDWMVTNAVLKASAPRRKRMVLVVLGEDVGHLGREDMDYVSKLCMCNNVVVFTVTVGEKFSSAQAEELSTFPVEQHMVHLGQLAQRDLKYAQRFIRGFLRMLSRLPSRVLWDVRDVQKNVYQTVSHLHNHTVAYSETTGYTEATILKEEEEEEEEEEDDDVAKPQSGPDESKARCLLNKDVGTVCANYESRWFYDRNMQRCTHFWYGGCGGNSNRFLTEMECLKTCGTHTHTHTHTQNLCQLPEDTGKCVDFLLKWHFNTQNQKCTTFWYGGCEGNSNRFDTQEECEARCLRAYPNNQLD
uniref:Collagen, type VI, alpha 4b n=1 Tax=Electrophorus electricus TaxID=8005 RepID=A0A4W4FJP8_ELEEL